MLNSRTIRLNPHTHVTRERTTVLGQQRAYSRYCQSGGYIVAEALISGSLVLLLTAGLWQLVTAATTLASTAHRHTEPACLEDNCSHSLYRIRCTCGNEVAAILN